MKLQSTADGLKAVKVTLEEILSSHTTGKGGLIDNEIYVPFDDALLAMAEAYGLNRNQPLEVKEQVREEAEMNSLAGTIALKTMEAENQTLQIMALSRNGVWDWMDISKDLHDAVLKECIKERKPYRLVTPKPSNPELGVEDKHIEIYKWLLGYYDFPEPPKEGRPRYYWRTHLREKLKEIGIEIPNPSTDGFPNKQ